ncbi:unnamed protein product [Polarella glacialis]|uniref:J domain-containing protein n=1 Tax=Polarella glacialis TaxID=89957 RepID=A0A813L2J8_POLGL|nr:unnamed protein product [Polarella glacialis]CAE8719261.1 unnamed protein product [Polarella glacialis]
MTALTSQDYYAVLGVHPSASSDEIRRAYKQQALLHHPDKNLGCVEEATLRFKRVAEAYSVLSEPERRAAYDAGDDPSDAEAGFTMGKAHHLFREVFGDQFAGRLRQAAADVVPVLQGARSSVADAVERVAEHEKVKAAAEATVFGLGLAADTIARSETLRGAVAAHRSSLVDDANENFVATVRAEALCKKAFDAHDQMLRKHQLQVAEVQKAREARRPGLWSSAWEWVSGEEKYEDKALDFSAAKESKKLQEQLHHAEAAWQQSCIHFLAAKAGLEKAEAQEEDAYQAGTVSLKDAAKAGEFFLGNLVGRLQARLSEYSRPEG